MHTAWQSWSSYLHGLHQSIDKLYANVFKPNTAQIAILVNSDCIFSGVTETLHDAVKHNYTEHGLFMQSKVSQPTEKWAY